MLGLSEFKSESRLWITRGINNRVTIASVVGKTNSVGNPQVVLTMHLEGKDPKYSTRFTIPLGGTSKKGIEKIVHLATALGITREQINSCDNDDIKVVGDNMNALMAGKTINRIKFCGEEYQATDGSGAVKVRTTIGLPRFAEGDDISESESRLEYDENRKFDFRPLQNKPAESETTENELPL